MNEILPKKPFPLILHLVAILPNRKFTAAMFLLVAAKIVVGIVAIFVF